MKLKNGFWIILPIFLISTISYAQPQNLSIFKQERNNTPPQRLSTEEIQLLNDPFFNLVLKENPDVSNLDDIENLIQPDQSKRKFFVVDERIVDPRPSQSRRGVITFSGSHKGEILQPNIMISIFFDSDGFRSPNIEVLAWDNKAGRYNYYKLDQSGATNNRLTWKFRGSSDGIIVSGKPSDELEINERSGTCMACHINGAPIMKELAIPWNNWHSFSFSAEYLNTSTNQHWPVAKTNRIRNQLEGAQVLETGFILPSITQFINNKIDSMIRDIPNSNNKQATNGQRLLKPLFETTEYNIISSRTASGLHVFPTKDISGPNQNVTIPNSFFLNANIIGGGTFANFTGLGISSAKDFEQIQIPPDDYKKVVKDSKVKLGGIEGDANFAWFVPEPSNIDNDMIDGLMKNGIVSPEFVASVIAVDLENPVFSPEREKLLKFIPQTFRFSPLSPGTNPLALKRHPDDLTKLVIENLKNSNPTPGSTEAFFLERLESDNPIKLLNDDVVAYRDRIKSLLESNNQQDRITELTRLHDKAIEKRKLAITNRPLNNLNETGILLFPDN